MILREPRAPEVDTMIIDKAHVVLTMPQELTDLILITTLCRRFCYLHFRDKETVMDEQLARGYVTGKYKTGI